MRRHLSVLVLPFLFLPLAAQQPSTRELFERARILEESNRNLDEAIALYGQVTAQSADRELAANALLRTSLLYERLGRRAEAERTFKILVTQYADQIDVARQAQARLGGARASAAQVESSRQVWTVPRSGTAHGNVSHDSRYVPYTSWAVQGGGGELFLRDVIAGTTRQITHDVRSFGDGYAWDAVFSPDDRRLAYAWVSSGRFELRIADIDTAGARPRVLFSNGEVPRISPQDWSPDGNWLAVQLQRHDKTAQIGVVSARDGSLRVLKSVDWRGSTKLFFSPDARYLAYDLPADELGERRDVFVLAIDGSRETPAMLHPANDVVIGWSPDGEHLLFASDRTGRNGLWALPVRNGSPSGAPEQLTVDLSGTSMGLASDGTLHLLVRHPSFTTIRSDIHAAAFDFTNGRFLSPSRPAVEAWVGANNFPAWSLDGSHLAFLSRRPQVGVPGPGPLAIVVRTESTGQMRELRPPLSIYVGGTPLRWSPDGRSIALEATDTRGRQGIFRLDATTGDVAAIALSSRGPAGDGEAFVNAAWSPDGKKVYYSVYARFDNPNGGSSAIVARDLASGQEREIIRRTGRYPLLGDLSPDGRYFAGPDGEWSAGAPAVPGRTGAWRILLIPASGGEPRELMRGESHGAGVLMWAPDSRSIFVYTLTNKATGEREVWRVPIDGGGPHRVEMDVNLLGPIFNSDQHLHPHPDGTRVAFAVAAPARPEEVWALENFLGSGVQVTRPAERSR